MSAALVRGWCPSLHRPMAARDGLLARVKPYGGLLDAPALHRLADAAQEHGSGRVELTGRGGLQVRGLSTGSAPRFAAAMVAASLAHPDPGAEAQRNVQLDPRAGPAMRAWAGRLERWLEDEAAGLGALPSKFGLALSPDGAPAADVVIEGEVAPGVRIAGSDLRVQATEPVAAVQALARAFLALAGGLEPPPRRMRALVERVGAPAVFAAAGLEPRPAPAAAPPAAVGPIGEGFGLGVALGATNADGLRAAAALAERFGDGRLQLGLRRTFHLHAVRPGGRDALAAGAAGTGFIAAPHDLRLRLHACVGQPGCLRTEADVRRDALRLATALGPQAPAGALHVSGCPKGCAHPARAALTLVAAAGGRGYHLLRDGAPCDPPPPGPPLALPEILQVLRP